MASIKDKNGLTEEEYLKTYNSDAWKKPSLTADICIIAKKDGQDAILLIKRGNHPHLGRWALPGGFSEEGECLEASAARELMEETGIKMSPEELTLVGVYSKPGRDPRGWTVSAAYLAVVEMDKVRPIASDDAAAVGWFTIMREKDGIRLRNNETELTLGDLAFDHEDIVSDAVNTLYK